jgi:hypothetical protein
VTWFATEPGIAVNIVCSSKSMSRFQPSTLALACDRCSAHKGPNLTGIDPETGEIVPLFNPREHIWEEHFRWSEATIIGRTAIGRTTIRVLTMNAERRLRLWIMLKRYGQL